MSQSGTAAAKPNRLKQGLALQQAGKLQEAARIYSDIVEEQPDNAEAWHLLGTIEIMQGRHESALALIKKALGLKPRSAVYLHNRAYVMGALGKLAEAEADYREAIRLRPNYAEAYFNLSGSAKFAADDPLIPGLESLLEKPGWSDKDRCFLHFAAGKIYDDIGETAKAFGHYVEGNKAKGVRFDAAQSRALFEAIAEVFSAEFLQDRTGVGCDSELPIFVVGMPRSGTTLVEQIIASHPKAAGAGELPDIDAIAKGFPSLAAEKGTAFPACMTSVPNEALGGLGEAYVRHRRQSDSQAERIVDKAPLNFRYLGLIALMFAKARIIHCRRDPIDTCLSCYFQNFVNAQYYSFDLATLGAFYRDYRWLMDHWRKVLPFEIYELDYERMVAAPEEEIPALIAFCGLDWDPACAAFHRTERTVGTASRWQVRQPVYKTSVRRSERYREFLGPLFEVLGPIAEPL